MALRRGGRGSLGRDLGENFAPGHVVQHAAHTQGCRRFASQLANDGTSATFSTFTIRETTTVFNVGNKRYFFAAAALLAASMSKARSDQAAPARVRLLREFRHRLRISSQPPPAKGGLCPALLFSSG